MMTQLKTLVAEIARPDRMDLEISLFLCNEMLEIFDGPGMPGCEGIYSL